MRTIADTRARPRRVAIALTGVLALTVGVPAIAQNAPAPRVDVPIYKVKLSDNTLRFALDIEIGGQPVRVGLDTGSVGLRVLPRAQFGAVPGSQRTAVTFPGANLFVGGTLASAPVSIGAAQGTIPIQAVDTLRCLNGTSCNGGNPPNVATFGFMGGGQVDASGQPEGFAAVFGAKPPMDGAVVPNPLIALGAHRWIITLPRPNESDNGHLIINPTDGDTAGFRPVPAGDEPGQVTACLIRDSASPTGVCGSAVLDSGAPGLAIQNGTDDGQWYAGTPIRLAYGQPHGTNPALAMTLDNPVQTTGFHITGTPGTPLLRTGVIGYFADEVMYDADQGRTFFRPRPPYPGGPTRVPR